VHAFLLLVDVPFLPARSRQELAGVLLIAEQFVNLPGREYPGGQRR